MFHAICGEDQKANSVGFSPSRLSHHLHAHLVRLVGSFAISAGFLVPPSQGVADFTGEASLDETTTVVALPVPLPAPAIGSLFDAPQGNCIDAPMIEEGGEDSILAEKNDEVEAVDDDEEEFDEDAVVSILPIFEEVREGKPERMRGGMMHRHRHGNHHHMHRLRKHKGKKDHGGYPGAPPDNGGGQKPPGKYPKNPKGPPKHIPGVPSKPCYPGMPGCGGGKHGGKHGKKPSFRPFGLRAPEPPFKVLDKAETYEIREYANLSLAWVSLPDGTVDRAPRDGFKLLYEYISGANKDEATGSCFKIPMFAPVFTQEDTETKGNIVMAFVLPPKIARIPTPTNPQVQIRTLPVWTAAVKSLSGSVGPEELAKAEAELRGDVKGDWKVFPDAKCELGRYDPPWVPGFFQKNEVFLPVKQA